MPYTTPDDIAKRINNQELLRLTDEYDSGVVDADRVAAAIDTAAGEIDSYLAARYDLPLSSVPGVIASVAVDIAIYTLYVLNEAGGVPESRQLRYDKALQLLAEIEAGERSLGIDGAEPQGAEAILTDGPERIFTRTKMSGL
jgi:phage gp36-like protein